MGRHVDNDIERTINAYMRNCIDENEDALEQRAKDAGNQAARALQRESRKRSGQYAKGWKSTSQRTVESIGVIVHAKEYQLTHLLENDHTITNQTGRSFGIAKGDKVIATIADRIGRQFASGGDAK